MKMMKNRFNQSINLFVYYRQGMDAENVDSGVTTISEYSIPKVKTQ